MNSIPPPILVTAALIRDGDKILIAQRLPDAKVEAGKWEFPGGKVEGGEHPEACLAREIREELALDIEVEKLFECVSHVYQEGLHVVLLCYLCRLRGGTLTKLEVADALWIRLDELQSYDFAQADLPIVARLKTSAFSLV